LQRILASHAAVATTSEPWLLLPLLYAPYNRKVYAEYGHSEYVKAFQDFCARLPSGRSDYLKAVKLYAEHLYGCVAGESATYFVDKTPRYNLIVREIIETFPQAKFIFLWRNPLGVAASMMETWSAGKWNLYQFRSDLYKGLANLVDAFNSRDEIALGVRYEDIVREPELAVRKILAYLDLPFDSQLAREFNGVKLEGRMGDPTGVEAYSAISMEPLDKWTDTIRNPMRKAWALRYIKWIGERRLSDMGYSMSEIVRELRHTPTSMRHLGSDLIRMSFGPGREIIKPLWLSVCGPRR